MPEQSRVLLGHQPFYGEAGEGTDILLHVHADGSYEVALRPGRDERWVTWGPPAEMKEEQQ